MPFTGAVYDPETLATLTAVFNEAWEEALGMGAIGDANFVRDMLAARIMAAAAIGERDPAKLKAAALGNVNA